MSWWRNKKVLVTGAGGFVGSHVVEELLRRGAKVTAGDRFESKVWRDNLKNVLPDVKRFKADFRDLAAAQKACKGQQIVLNLAAKVGGIAYNSAHHGSLFRENVLIASNVIEAARLSRVEKFLVTSSACVYARRCSIPTPEREGFVGDPEPTNAGYGWAKRMAEYLGKAYHDEYGMTVAIARPYNAYGPRDHYDSKDAHVIPSLVRRAVAGEDPLVVWGDGSPSRSFLYVEDMARGLVEVVEKYPEADPVNLGNDEETTIKELVETIKRLSGTKARLQWDKTKPLGQPRRRCDVRKAKKLVGFEARISLEEGLRRSIEWYRARRGRTR